LTDSVDADVAEVCADAPGAANTDAKASGSAARRNAEIQVFM
jgi:hypothetical protein